MNTEVKITLILGLCATFIILSLMLCITYYQVLYNQNMHELNIKREETKIKAISSGYAPKLINAEVYYDTIFNKTPEEQKVK
jgi:hypothetical protein